MKSYTRSLLMSIFTIVLTAIALATSTFAWFSLSKISNISNINGTIQSGDSLEVRLSGDKLDGTGTYSGNYKSNLNSKDWLSYQNGIGLNNFTFSAVTTTNGIDFKHLKQNESSGDLLISPLLDGKNKEYLEFNIDFRSEKPGDIKLTNINFDDSPSAVWNNSGGADYKQFSDTLETNYQVETSAANAARVAIISTNGINAYQKDAFQNEEGNIIDNGYLVDHNLKQYKGNSFTNHNVTPIYGQWSYLKDAKGIMVYEEVNGELEEIAYDLNSIKTLKAKKLEDASDTISLSTDALNGYHTASITVRIWIEGWDADAYDSIFNLELKVNLTFNKVD